MKFLQLLSIFLFASCVSYSQIKKDTLTNEKIIKMVNNKISSILIQKSILKASYCIFDLTSDGIINLKNNKVSDSIIISMFDRDSSFLSNRFNTDTDNKDQTSIQSTSQYSSKSLDELNPGIYYETRDKSIRDYIRLQSTTSAPDLDKFLSSNIEYAILGKTASTVIYNSLPEFYLKVGVGFEDIVYQPSQFIVLYAKEKKGNRYIQGKTGVFTSNIFEFNKKYIITPKFIRINDTLYKITFEKRLPKGHYFFGPKNRLSGKNFLEFDISI